MTPTHTPTTLDPPFSVSEGKVILSGLIVVASYSNTSYADDVCKMLNQAFFMGGRAAVQQIRCNFAKVLDLDGIDSELAK